MTRYKTPICDGDPNNTPMIQDTIIMSLLILTLCCLLTHSLYTEFSERNDLNSEILSIKSRVGYIVLQCLALYWVTSDLIRFIIDPLHSFLPNTFGCIFLTYSATMVPGVFYTVYLYLILLRLENLNGSYLSTSVHTSSILRFFITSVMVFQGVFLCIDDDPVCLHPLHPPDMDRKLRYCELRLTDDRKWLALGAITMIALLNLAMGALFARKLQQIVRVMQANQHLNIRLREIVIQSTLLTVTGSISTFACYILWFLSPFPTGLWLYLDSVVNCCVIGLTFPRNRQWYKGICGQCIKCCRNLFDSTEVELPQIQKQATLSLMASIGEDVVLELGPRLVPQNENEPNSIEVRAPRPRLSSSGSDSSRPMDLVVKRKWGILGQMYKPSGSLSACDPEESEGSSCRSSRGSSLASLSEMKTDDGAITRKPTDENMEIKNGNKNKPSDEIPLSAEAILRTPRISTMPRSLTDVPLSNFLISPAMAKFLSKRRIQRSKSM